jgi:hypothetical protein
MESQETEWNNPQRNKQGLFEMPGLARESEEWQAGFRVILASSLDIGLFLIY